MKSLIAAVVVISLSGCATMERHPYLTAFGTALVVGSIAATVEANSSSRDHVHQSIARSNIQPVTCAVPGSCE